MTVKKKKPTKRKSNKLFATLAGVKQQKTAAKRVKHVKREGKSFKLNASQKKNLPAALQKAILAYHHKK